MHVLIQKEKVRGFIDLPPLEYVMISMQHLPLKFASKNPMQVVMVRLRRGRGCFTNLRLHVPGQVRVSRNASAQTLSCTCST